MYTPKTAVKEEDKYQRLIKIVVNDLVNNLLLQKPNEVNTPRRRHSQAEVQY